MNRHSLFQLTLLLLLLAATAVSADAAVQEPYQTYPTLPTGYRSIRVFDRQRRFVGRLLPEQRYWVPLNRIPLFLQKAVVAVEDSRFYEHGGIDIRGIARAAVKDLVTGRLVQGGSTITQQLIKNKYLSNEKSLDRKINEGLMAIEFERKYTKQQILEMYLNEIYYGNGAWGIAQAARIYFDKSPEELTDAECVLLAGIPKNPGRYNPLAKPAEVGQRRDIVLKRMLEVGAITPRQYRQVRNHPAAPIPPDRAPYYLALLRAQLTERYGAGVIEQGGLEVTAALDLPLQLAAEKAIRTGVARISPQLQGALVAIDPATGDLLAAVGGVDYRKSPYNRAVYAKRQPGSAIKPLLYAFALEQGATAGDLWDDTPVSYPRGNGQTWRPLNYDGRRHGVLSLRQALATSNNVIAVKLLDTVGAPAFADFAATVGLPLRPPPDLSMALGTDEVTLHDLVLAYAPLDNGGNRVQSRSIIRIYDTYRHTWREEPVHSTPVLSPASAFITTQMMRDVLTTGTAKVLRRFARRYPAAGKTGTTSDYHDAWFIGYTPHLMAGVWVGYDQPRSGGRGFTGGAIAAPIWERFMLPALAGKPITDFAKPDTVLTVSIDPATGLLAAPDCPRRRTEFYAAGTEPGDYSPCGSPPAAPIHPDLTTP